MNRLIVSIVSAAVLAGCAPMRDGVPEVQPIAPQAVGLHAAATAMEWPAARWWQRYGDAQLDRLVEAALAGSPDMVAAEARLRQAQAAVGRAGAALLPTVDANGTLTRQHYSEHYVYPEPLGGSVGSDARLALDARYELDLWGKYRSGLDAARSSAEAAQANVQWARNVLVLAVVQGYADLQNAWAQQHVLAQSLARADDVLSLTQARYEAGLDTQVEVRQAEAQRAEVRVQASQVENDIARFRHQLAALQGAGPDTALSLEPATLQMPAQARPAEVPLALLGRRPDIVAARWQAEAAGAEVQTAKAAFYPNVSLAAFVGLLTLNTATLFDQGSRMAGVTPAISLPLFEGGRLNADLDARRAQRDEAVAGYNQAVLGGVREVADALDSLRLVADEARHQRDARLALDAAYTLARDRYAAGLGDYLTVLSAQAGVLEQTRRDTALAARAWKLDAGLMTALGGGYAEPAQTAF
ncbi:MAG: efflux transporter outer membrane subunit [Corticimicrobacter sp.]|uniref:efflux transporter outer membrane subunit n=1 Tax=Corticimicrobacter sp. TaxID=2678536 RepID=UPI0032DB47CB